MLVGRRGTHEVDIQSSSICPSGSSRSATLRRCHKDGGVNKEPTVTAMYRFCWSKTMQPSLQEFLLTSASQICKAKPHQDAAHVVLNNQT